MTEKITGIDQEQLQDSTQPSILIRDFIVLLSALPFVALLLIAIAVVSRLTTNRLMAWAILRINEKSSDSQRKRFVPGSNDYRRTGTGQDPAQNQNHADHPRVPASRVRISLLLHDAMSMLLDGKRLNYVLAMRNRHYLGLDLIALSLTPAAALTLRQEGLGWLPEALPALFLYTGLSLLIKVTLFYLLGLYGRYWPHASVSDVSRLIIAVGQSTVLLALFFIAAHPLLMARDLAIPRSIAFIDGMITVLVAGGIRFSLRGFYDWHRSYRNRPGGRHVLIVGAGEAGMMTVREIWSNPKLMLEPVAFVDDDPAKIGTFLHGIPVVGKSENIPDVVDFFGIQRIIVAMPSAPLPKQQALINLCRQTGIVTDTLPGIYQILAGHKAISPLPQIDINRMLRRDPVVVDDSELASIITGAKVMVTGAGGSIGSELCRQIARFNPAELILLGHGENSIFEIDLDLTLRFPGLITRQVIADVRDGDRISWAVRTYRPQIIFHAAAHKHVPFMEASMPEAVMNNVLGTRSVLHAADRYDVERFVLISSDKAINPANVMGVTKRIAELLTLATAQKSGRAYMVVRFGNVLGSRGSVLPVFQRQIAAGGPVTITHKDMYRYFMTIPEAVQLVLQSTVLGKGGEIFVLDMGEPVRIIDMAVDLITLCGLQPQRDIDIVFSGVRPGEKLREELFLPSEEYQRSEHEKIFVAAHQARIDPDALGRAIDQLVIYAAEMKTYAMIEQMRNIVPEYQPHPYKEELPSTHPLQGKPIHPRTSPLVG